MSQRDPRFPTLDDNDGDHAHRPDSGGAHPRLGPTELSRILPPRRRLIPVMETVLLASTAALLAAVAWPIATSGGREGAQTQTAAEPTPAPEAGGPAAAPVPATDTPTIQIALLLDTSSSMDGLIDQARSQLWRVVNAIDTVTWHGDRPRLEVALYEYGNDDLTPESGWIRQVSPFTVELDRVSEKLFALRTNGGSEYAGQVIARSLDELAWRTGEGTLKVVYIAGNEELAQGPVDWRSAIESAKAKGVVVNTVDCATGGFRDPGWAEAAALAGGRFMQIDQSAVAEYIEAPQDAEIARLGTALNGTYVGYGAEGRYGLENQIAQDDNSAKMGVGSSIQRAITKSTSYYANPTWDLVDAVDGNVVTLAEIDRGGLPAEARDLDDDALGRWLDAKRSERAEIQEKLGTLAAEREAWLAEERVRRHGEDADRLDTAIVRSILEQASTAGFTIDTSAS